ncbi:unnamed protein product [Adineta ricciae]|uniref:dual-specificity kinase n=1 Tax=Adineta ricciae TaxID=249248 RepID=A0A814XP61_ADIRI|nr:unnamed protein product [Adineta ricciae]CAF1370552.1 unnamed protein product [Adineta ricciae]
MASIDQQRQFYMRLFRRNNDSVRKNMTHSLNDIGLSVTAKPLAKPKKLSVQPLLIDQKNVNKSLNHLPNENSNSLFNKSFQSDKSSIDFNRSLRRGKISNGSLKSFSKEYFDSSTIDEIHHLNQSTSSIYSNSHLLSKSQIFDKSFHFPLKSSEALKYYGDELNDFERNEIFDYDEIYYLGLKAKKLCVKDAKDYDDEYGYYRKVLHDHICYRYEILEMLGKGSFGIVMKCFDHKKKEFCALKILKNKKRFQQQGLVEIQILNHLKLLDQYNSFHIVHIKQYFYFRSHLCITFELLGINLYELIQKNHFNGFSPNLVKRFTYSILQTLQILANERIIHCDLKPENILLKEKGSSQIKIIDFGSGCFQSNKIYTYIQSRFYRAPEIILGIPYTCAIDMWSLACIIVELLTGYPIFPGDNEQEQLAMIMEVFDVPPNDFIQQGTRRQLFFDSKNHPRCSSSKTMKKRRPGTRPLSHIIRTNDFYCLDFLNRCFHWNPNERLTPSQGLNHPWINQINCHRRHRQRMSISNSIKTNQEDAQSIKTFPRLINQ